MTDDPVHIAVVGGGISGLAAAHRLITSAPPASLRVTVFEASDRFGGWIRTELFAGRPVDFGPDSLLVRTPWATELCRELGIEDELVAPGSGGAYLLSRGKLRTLPSGILAGLPNGPMPFVRSGLLGPLGIARAALDLVLPNNAPDGDESIGDLVRRRLGGQTLERVIDPLLGGVHAGRCDDLSLAATAPQIAAAARADRSLLRGLRKTAAPKANGGTAAHGATGAAPQTPAPVFMGPRGGMQRIVDELVSVLGGVADLRTSLAVTAIEPCARRPRGVVDGVPLSVDGVRLIIEGDDEPLEFDGVIIAAPAGAAAALVEPHSAGAARTLADLTYASVAQTALAYDPADLPTLPAGTGFLVPRPEGTVMTACTLLDQKWPERERSGDLDHTVVIKCSAGRVDDHRVDDLTDDQLVATLHDELAQVIGPIRARPIASHVFRASNGLPQYEPGHLTRIEAVVREVAETLPAATLTGAAYRGTSVPVCIREGRAAADTQLARLLPPA